MATVSETIVQTEQEKVEAWRYEWLLRLGYDPSVCERIARCADVEMHRLEALIAQGCSLDLALEILS
jgi:hypothetical protein